MKLFDRQGFELAGWVIFVASAAMFIASGVRAGDAFSTAGSVLFLGACFVFLAPLVHERRRQEK
jgi:hypothetical protein